MSAALLLLTSARRLIDFYGLLLILYILGSWIPQLRYSRVGEVLAQVSEPYLRLFQGVIPPLGGMDFSPILAFIVLRLVRGVLNQALRAL